MIMTTIMINAHSLVTQRTDQEVFNLVIIATLSKRSKVLTIAVTTPSTLTIRSLYGLRPLHLAQIHLNSINLGIYNATFSSTLSYTPRRRRFQRRPPRQRRPPHFRHRKHHQNRNYSSSFAYTNADSYCRVHHRTYFTDY